jgi:hypothetical protein
MGDKHERVKVTGYVTREETITVTMTEITRVFLDNVKDTSISNVKSMVFQYVLRHLLGRAYRPDCYVWGKKVVVDGHGSYTYDLCELTPEQEKLLNSVRELFDNLEKYLTVVEIQGK